MISLVGASAAFVCMLILFISWQRILFFAAFLFSRTVLVCKPWSRGDDEFDSFRCTKKVDAASGRGGPGEVGGEHYVIPSGQRGQV